MSPDKAALKEMSECESENEDGDDLRGAEDPDLSSATDYIQREAAQEEAKRGAAGPLDSEALKALQERPNSGAEAPSSSEEVGQMVQYALSTCHARKELFPRGCDSDM